MITAKILSVATDENGNVKVSTEYSLDGKVVQVGNTRYSASQSLDKDDIIARIDADIQQHCENLISRKFVATKNVGLVTDLSSIVNKTYQAETAKLTVGDSELTVDEGKVISTKEVVKEIV
jgi:hypothetical protein